MKLELRSLSTADSLAHVDLFQRAVAESAATFLADADREVAPGTAERLLRGVDASPVAIALVALSDEGATAVCLTAPLADPLFEHPTACVVALWVDPRLRHRGIARAMVREIRRLLTEVGVDRIAARTGHTDDALISMGERWGFVRSWELLIRE